MPFGKGKKFANQGGVVNVLAGGWKIAAVQKYQSGTPLSVSSPGWTSGIFAGGEGATGFIQPSQHHFRSESVGVNSTANSSIGKASESTRQRFARAEFHLRRRTPFPRVRELFNDSEDFNVAKAIPMFTERVHTDFRVEFFDVFNRHRFTGFNTSITCTPTPTNNCPPSGEGQGTGLAYGPRNIQGSLRVAF